MRTPSYAWSRFRRGRVAHPPFPPRRSGPLHQHPADWDRRPRNRYDPGRRVQVHGVSFPSPGVCISDRSGVHFRIRERDPGPPCGQLPSRTMKQVRFTRGLGARRACGAAGSDPASTPVAGCRRHAIAHRRTTARRAMAGRRTVDNRVAQRTVDRRASSLGCGPDSRPESGHRRHARHYEMAGLKNWEWPHIQVLVPPGRRVPDVPGVAIEVHPTRRHEPYRFALIGRPEPDERRAFSARRCLLERQPPCLRRDPRCRRPAAAHHRGPAPGCDGEERSLRHRRFMQQILDDIAGGAQALAEIDIGRLCRSEGLNVTSRQALRLDGRGRADTSTGWSQDRTESRSRSRSTGAYTLPCAATGTT